MTTLDVAVDSTCSEIHQFHGLKAWSMHTLSASEESLGFCSAKIACVVCIRCFNEAQKMY